MSDQVFGNILLGTRAGVASGSLKASPTGIIWKRSGGGKTVEVPADEISALSWSRIPQRSCLLAIKRSEGPTVSFIGFTDADIQTLSKAGLPADVNEQPLSLSGHNWGSLAFEGSALAFNVDGKPAFRFPLPDVTQVQQARDDVTLEFPNDDTTIKDREDALTGISFFIPKNNPEFTIVDDGTSEQEIKEGPNGEAIIAAPPIPCKVFVDKISAFTDTGVATGDAIATFDSVGIIVPRGRFDVEMYGSSLKLVGQAQDFRVQYDSIVRIFMLPKPNSAVTLVAISLDPPIRRGQTYYPHILCQFPADEETSIELDITEEALAARNQRSKAAGGRGDLVKKLTGSTAEVFAKVLRGLSGSRLSKPGSFKDAEGTGQAIRCSYKADDGYVFPLERAFFYIQKPPLLLTYDEVDSVEFMRQATGITAARTFDLQVRMKTGTDHIFRGIPRSEWTNLFEFIQAKSLRVENFREAKAGPGATRPHYAMGDEGGPDAGLAKLEAQGGMSDGSDEDEDEEEEDEDFAASSDDSSSSSDSDSEGDAIVVDEDDVKVGKGSGEKKKKKKRPATEDADSGSDQEGAAAGGGGSAKKKQRKKKDPNAPKKGMSAFMLFSNAIRATVKAESPELSFGDIAKAISEKWKVLDPAEKGKYEAQAAADKERYEREKKEYVTKQAGGGGGGGGEEEEMQVKDDDKEVKEEEEKEEGEKEAAAPEIIKQEEKLAEVKAEEPGAEVK